MTTVLPQLLQGYLNLNFTLRERDRPLIGWTDSEVQKGAKFPSVQLYNTETPMAFRCDYDSSFFPSHLV